MAKKTLETVQAEIAKLKKIEREMKAEKRREALAKSKAEKAKRDTRIADLVRQYFINKDDDFIVEYFEEQLKKREGEKQAK